MLPAALILALQACGVTAQEAASAGQLQVSSATETYLAGGAFDRRSGTGTGRRRCGSGALRPGVSYGCRGRPARVLTLVGAPQAQGLTLVPADGDTASPPLEAA